MKRFRRTQTGSRVGDLLLAGIFLLVVAVGILTTTLLWRFDSGAGDLVLRNVTPVQQRAKGLVFLGDSLAQGVGATQPDTALAYRVYAASQAAGEVLWNFGLAGAKIEQVKSDQLQRLQGVVPSGVFLIVGANDVTGQTDPATFKAAYADVLKDLASRNVKVTVLSIPNLAATPAIPQARKEAAAERVLLLNEYITELVAQYPTMKLVDLYAFSTEQLVTNTSLLADDKYHPNDAGYEKLAAYVVGK